MANRIIQISWSQVTGSGLTGYNIYLVKGAPESATKQLLVFNNGLTNTSYTYTGVEGVQYQFEVRATDGTNEGPPLEIFYPSGGALWTPTVITPTGNPMMIARDNQYITKDDFLLYPTGLHLTTSSSLYTSGMLDKILQASSAMVNRYCHNYFDVQTIDEVYDGVRISSGYPQMINIPLNYRPIQNVVRIDLQILKWFISIDLQYLQVFPEKGYIQIVPYLGGGSGAPLPAAVLTEGVLAKIWTQYTFGYDVLPFEIGYATALYATKLIGLQENPVGAKSVKFGRDFSLEFDQDNDPITNQAHKLLEPYVNIIYRRP